MEDNERIWNIFHKYFDFFEFAGMIKNKEETEKNVLLFAIQFNIFEVIKFLWSEIHKILGDAQMIEFLKYAKTNGENIFHELIRRPDIESLRFFIEKLTNIFTKTELMEMLTQKTAGSKTTLHYAGTQENFEFFKTFWKFLCKTLENQEELKDLMMQKDDQGFDFIAVLIALDRKEFLKFTISETKRNFTSAQYKQILKSIAMAFLQNAKGYNEQRLIELALFNDFDDNLVQGWVENLLLE